MKNLDRSDLAIAVGLVFMAIGIAYWLFTEDGASGSVYSAASTLAFLQALGYDRKG